MIERIAVIGLGYVGLPVAVAVARAFPDVIGFDVNERKIAALRRAVDETGEVSSSDLESCGLNLTSNPNDLRSSNFFIVAVPTPIDRNHQPDLTMMVKASEIIGSVMQPGTVVVYESTVYPGVTEEICGPTLEKVSGLRQSIDFKLGYSPERINPGDREHTLSRIVKVVSAEDEPTLNRVAAVYSAIVQAGIYRAPTIRVAEAAKVIENTQRDLNIALMNELALIFDRLGICTRDVLAAANTKWNFLPFTPGLVGGHCIGVDPYYLTKKAEEVGYHPQVILAGRRINDGMGQQIAQRLVKLLIHADIPVRNARVGILGLTFKENVPDIRNSRVPDIVSELRQFGVDPLVHDPLVDARRAHDAYGICLTDWEEMTELDCLVLAVGHRKFLQMPREKLLSQLRPDGVLMDVKSLLDPSEIPSTISYWSL
ncbi:MAG TPA: nucleotide sugar dehydrogenase [Armatimonadota bacterium]|nr:nucleotide sugar dehydrogenase [Armatimonadota bacterium]